MKMWFLSSIWLLSSLAHAGSCNAPIDLVFALDSSGSGGEVAFEAGVNQAKVISEFHNIGEDKTHIAVTNSSGCGANKTHEQCIEAGNIVLEKDWTSDSAEIANFLTYDNENALGAGDYLAGFSWVYDQLLFAYTQLQNSERPDARKVIVLMSDGPAAPVSKSLCDENAADLISTVRENDVEVLLSKPLGMVVIKQMTVR